VASGSRTPVADVLERIVAARRRAVKQAKQNTPAAKLEERAAAAPPVRDFAAALSGKGLNVIAELKKASPSRGVLRANYNPAQLAPALEAVGACALSVLTEPEFFHGALEDLHVAHAVTRLPALRKDFIFDPYQLFEARAAGADAFLLIAAILKAAELQELITLGKQLGMAALVEAHTADELERALEAGAEMVGINNRSLRTFEVSLETSLQLIGAIPETHLAVSESGLHTRDDLRRLRAAGFDAFLVGEHLMQAVEPASALRQLLAEV
jgi:indole-3-glycerol phosphate synthase